jgi:hypothetical protein
MVKDSKKYASTGGWGFGHFNDRDEKNLATRRCSKPAFPATKRGRIATLSSLATHRDALAHDLTLKEAPLQLAAVSAAEFDRIVDPRKMVKPYVAVN